MHLNCSSAPTQRRSCWSPTLCTVWHPPTCRILHPTAHSPSPALTVSKPLRGDVTREHPSALAAKTAVESGGGSEPRGDQRFRVWTTDAHLHPWKHSTTGWEGKYRGPRKEAQLIGDLRRKSELMGKGGTNTPYGREAGNRAESLPTTDHSQIKGPKLK